MGSDIMDRQKTAYLGPTSVHGEGSCESSCCSLVKPVNLGGLQYPNEAPVILERQQPG